VKKRFIKERLIKSSELKKDLLLRIGLLDVSVSGGASTFADYMPPSGEEFCDSHKYNAPSFDICQLVEIYLNIMKY